jgi:hypothetical protein
MAHFAQLDENNIVINVIVVSNDDILDPEGNESEELGILFCKNLLGEDTRWVQTSYNRRFRHKFAYPGMYYNEERDVFHDPIEGNLYPDSWFFDEKSLKFKPPVKHPRDGNSYTWDEEILGWKLIKEQ